MIVTILLSTNLISAQSAHNKTSHVEPTKAKKSKTEIEKNLVGHWAFYEMISPQGEKIR